MTAAHPASAARDLGAGGPRRLLVVGSGLIGTSVAMALRSAAPRLAVFVSDRDEETLGLAVHVSGAGAWDGKPVDHLVIAAPPRAVGQLVREYLDLTTTISDVSSVQSRPQREVETIPGAAERFCGSHPMAGREGGGPAAAAAELFRGRPWVLVPSPATAPVALAAAAWVASACGAVTLRRSAGEHDDAVAAVSHLPQLVASALAAALREETDDALALSGPGVLDTTRIAASPAQLWAELVADNAPAVVPRLARVRALLDEVQAAAGSGEDVLAGAVGDLVTRGNAGRARLPGKRGEGPDTFRWVSVVLQDRPGQLAALLAAAATAEINVEDIRVDHVPGLPLGLVDLAVSPGDASRAVSGLRSLGWTVPGSGAEPSRPG